MVILRLDSNGRSQPASGAVLVALLTLLWPAAPGVRAESVSDREVKAAMLYNFTKFVEWPTGAEWSGPVSICVAGRDPFGPVLDQAVADRTANGRPIRIVRGAFEELRRCHILYVSASEKKRMQEILAAVPGGVLTVSDLDDFTRDGGMVGFVLQDSKVRFEINLEAAERARLKISARLLKLATVVRHPGGGGRNR